MEKKGSFAREHNRMKKIKGYNCHTQEHVRKDFLVLKRGHDYGMNYPYDKQQNTKFEAKQRPWFC